MENRTVNMNIPVELLPQLERLMQDMEIKEEIAKEKKVKLNENRKFEVKNVSGHRKNSGGWSFQVNFKDGSQEWVHENDCNCEFSINSYLHSIGIATDYLVCRVSTKKQSSCLSTSLEGQKKELLKFRNAHNRTTPRRTKIITISESAYKGIPRELQKVGESALKGDTICVWRVDRLSRNIILFTNWLEDLDKRQINIISYTERLSYSGHKLDFLEKILQAQKESAAIGERVKLSYKRKRERGDERIGGLPYGKRYKKERVGSRFWKSAKNIRNIVVDDPHETKIINKIRKSSCDAHEMASTLNKRKMFKRGKKWNARMIKRMRK